MNKAFKSTLAVILAGSVMTAAVACAPKTEESDAPQLISGGTVAAVATSNNNEETNVSSVSGALFTVSYKGVVITPGMDAEIALKALGEGYVKSPDIHDCARYDAVSTSYDYKDLVLFVDNDNDERKYTVNTIDVRSSAVDCGGVRIGSRVGDIRKVYGEPTSEEVYGLCYEKNKTQVQFISVDEETVSSILFKAVI